LVSASELRRGLEAERVMPRRVSGGRLGSWLVSDSPAEPRVTELPAFLRDVLQEPGASGAGGLPGSCYRASNSHHLLFSIVITQLKHTLAVPSNSSVCYLFHLAGCSAHWHGGRKQAGGVAFVVQVVNDLSVFRFLCKRSAIDKTLTRQFLNTTYYMNIVRQGCQTHFHRGPHRPHGCP